MSAQKKSSQKAKRKAVKKRRKKAKAEKAAEETGKKPGTRTVAKKSKKETKAPAEKSVEKPQAKKAVKEPEVIKPIEEPEVKKSIEEPQEKPEVVVKVEKPREEPEEEKAAEELQEKPGEEKAPEGPREKPGTESTQPKEAPPMRLGVRRERGERKTITSAPVVVQEPVAVIRVERLETPASTVIMTMGGFLQRREANQLMRTVESLQKENITHILFDMSHVQYANSSAIGAFVNCASKLKADGGEAVLVAMRPNIRRIFETLGLIGLFIAAGSKEKAIEAIS